MFGSRVRLFYKDYLVNVNPSTSLVWAELLIAIAKIFRRLDMELFDTVRERDIEHGWGGLLGEPSKEIKGVRVVLRAPQRH